MGGFCFESRKLFVNCKNWDEVNTECEKLNEIIKQEKAELHNKEESSLTEEERNHKIFFDNSALWDPKRIEGLDYNLEVCKILDDIYLLFLSNKTENDLNTYIEKYKTLDKLLKDLKSKITVVKRSSILV